LAVWVEDLINRLRKDVGQDQFSGAEAVYATEQPAWFSESRVVAGLDAGSMLAAGRTARQPGHRRFCKSWNG
jgi:hypothetical protein